MADQSEPFAMWHCGASHCLLPLDQLPGGANDTRKAIVKLAVGHAPALFWKGEVVCKECRAPLVPANKVVQALDLVSVVNGRKLTLWIKSGVACELLVDLKRRGD
eukprot:12918000-Prorocentrum_lima.AAC.1